MTASSTDENGRLLAAAQATLEAKRNLAKQKPTAVRGKQGQITLADGELVNGTIYPTGFGIAKVKDDKAQSIIHLRTGLAFVIPGLASTFWSSSV